MKSNLVKFAIPFVTSLAFISCKESVPDSVIQDALREEFRINTSQPTRTIINQYEREIDKETYHIVEYKVEWESSRYKDEIRYHAFVKRGNGWFNMRWQETMARTR